MLCRRLTGESIFAGELARSRYPKIRQLIMGVEDRLRELDPELIKEWLNRSDH